LAVPVQIRGIHHLGIEFLQLLGGKFRIKKPFAGERELRPGSDDGIRSGVALRAAVSDQDDYWTLGWQGSTLIEPFLMNS